MSRREALASLKATVGDSSPEPQTFSRNFTRRTKSVRSFGGDSISPQINVDAIIDKIKNMEDSKLKDQIEELTKIIDIYRKINVLKSLPSPLGVCIPEELNPEDYYKYATEYSAYTESFMDLEDEPFVEEDRRCTMLSMFAYLYNAKKMSKKEGEDPLEFFEKCKNSVDTTLILFRENAKERNIELPAYINELRF